MSTGPAVRARHMKALLASVDRLPDGRPPAIRGALGPDAVAQIEDSSGVEWLELELNLALSHALRAALDDAAFERFHRAHSFEAFRGPLFRAIHDGVVALFGRDLEAWARFIPTGWSATFRDCGRWSIAARGDGRVGLVLSELPPATLVDGVWPWSVAASLSALADLTQMDGAVSVVGLDRAARTAAFELRWNPPALASREGTG